MDTGKAWEKFIMSGSVSDYLNYKKIELLNSGDNEEDSDYAELIDNDGRTDP